MKTKNIYLAIVSILMISLQSNAGIPVSGVVNGTWTQGDTMDVVGDLYIVSGDTLTIEPSVVVKFMDYYRFYVYGLLLANGTANDTIYFTCDLIQNPNKWGGIRFTNADSSCSLSYFKIENGLAQNPEPNGGGVYCSNSSPTFSQCIFENNHAKEFGGGIGMYTNSSPDISNCIFVNNSAEWGGGGIRIAGSSSPTVTNCTISNNSAGSAGGLHCGNNSTPEFTNCQFTENFASTDDGGAIGCYNSSTLTLYSCDIANNHTSGGYGDNGGGIYADNSTITLTDCNITGNYNASYGGGIYAYASVINITNSAVSNNSVLNRGGGIYLESSNGGEITNCTISNNSASNYGGGIYLYYCTIGLTNCDFNYNTAALSGGGMYIRRWWASMINCTFIANNAPGQNEGNGGGGICVADYQGGVDLTDCWFEDNTAYRGGGIYGCSWSSNSSIENCTFINNSADPQGGGGIYNYGANITISECLFEGNQCVGYGGGINNADASPSISKCVIVGNIAIQQGGGIVNSGISSPKIQRCTLYNNSASIGGGIANINNSTPIINSTIVDSSNGFGIYFGTGSSSSTVKYCDFNNNFPIIFGGSDVPAGLGIISGTNFNNDPCDAFSNIFLDPLFVDAGNDSFQLQSGSPCIDAGDPNILPDPDNTIADIGAFYYDQTTEIGGQQDLNLPLSLKLDQNYPNPFNPVTNIRFGLPKASQVKIEVFNTLGQRVATLLDEYKQIGYHTVQFDGSNFSSGVYYYKIQAGDPSTSPGHGFSQVRKMLLVK